MRLGIRAKLVGMLLLAGLLPLAAALGVILFGVVQLRVQSHGRVSRALAQQQARHLSATLGAQVELANLINAMPGTPEFLRAANAAPAPSIDEIRRIESSWPTLRPGADPLLDSILNNEVAARWKTAIAIERRSAEVMVTDAAGRLVAATQKTSDYYQADEEWWTACWNGGNGRVLISAVIFDESAIPPGGDQPGTLVADLCVPIYDYPPSAPDRQAVGVAKISLDATWMLRQVEIDPASTDVPRTAWVVRGNGRAVPGTPTPPPIETLPPKVAARLAAEPAGWVKVDTLDGHELLGFAEVEQSRLIEQAGEQWHVVVTSSFREVAGSVYKLAWTILGLGLLVIGGCFFGGMVIARRGIIRPLLTLDHAVDQIKAGRRDFRLSEARGRGQTFRHDEIGGLAHDFNTMADQLQRNLERVEEADALKRQFIDLASHELRTPVTYLLGVSQLAQRQPPTDAQPADGGVIARISAKAQRLSRIVDNMFKLLASDRFDRAPRWSDVDVAAVIATCAQDLEPFLHERNQHWQIEIDPGLPTIRADADKVRDIVTNLANNAIRFSPDAATIGIRATASDAGVAIDVTDQGAGIPQADLPHLFQPFFTGGEQVVSRHTSGEYQHMSRGIGLGLSVVKRFVDLHGGTVSVDTSPNGTRVRVRLPMEPPGSDVAKNA